METNSNIHLTNFQFVPCIWVEYSSENVKKKAKFCNKIGNLKKGKYFKGNERFVDYNQIKH